ncbi:MAG: hypothetical protein E7364_00555 [Clostridiales bacterium]|nr:hypothetical protein [Clostridiales bacterium]
MTRLTKKVLTWLLSAFAFMALALGIAFGRPQIKKASAETLSTENWTLAIEGDYAFRIQNGNTYWSTYTNDVTTESMLDYTEINGKTLSEINAETPGAITVTLQPAGGTIGSFYRVTINSAVSDLTRHDLGTVKVRAGWSHTDANGTYTIDTDLYFAHKQTAASQGDTWKYIPAANVVDISDDIVLQDQGVIATNTRSILLKTTGTAYWSGFTPNEHGGAFLNMLYVNGTSVRDWNKQAHAALDAGEITDITYGSGHGTISGNKGVYAPIFVWNAAYDAGVGGCYAQTWIPTGYISNVSSYKVSKGMGWLTDDGTFYYVAKDVEYVKSGSSFEKVASAVDISDTLTFYNGGTSEATDTYYIYTKGGQKWTAAYGSTGSTALGEYEWKGQSDTSKQGGSVQMSFMYINGQSVYDINATDNEAYGSTHGNISSGTAKFAPIMAWVVPYNSTLGGSAITIQIPSAYPGNKTTITIKKGFYVVDTSTNIKYEVTKDVQWDYENGAWGEHVEKIETSVDDAKIFFNGSSTTDAFAGISLAGSDYAVAPSTYAGTVKTAKSYAQSANFLSHILIDDAALNKPGEAYLNVWGKMGYFTFRPGNVSATKITILAGCQFPTYNALLNGAKEVYVTTEDVTFIKDSSGNWVLDEGVTTYTVTVDGVAQTVEEGGYAVAPTETPTKAEDENYTYTFDNWYIVDTDIVFDFDTAITQDYNVESRFTANPKDTTVQVSFTAVLDKDSNDTYGKSIRFNTVGVQWTTSHSWVAAADWASIADNTLINGKSVTEINAGITEGQKLTLMMQPAQDSQGNYSFSFLRVYIPEAVMSVDNVMTMAIKEGWSFDNGSKTYVASATQEFYNSAGAMATISEKLSSSEVTISDLRVDGVENELYKVDITSTNWTIGVNEFDYNYFGAQYQNVRRNIYINGVSIYDINTTVDDSSYTYRTSPMTNTSTDTGTGYDLFANPVLIQSIKGGNTLTLWIHKDYIASLGTGDITVTLDVGLAVVYDSGTVLLEEKSQVVGGNYVVRVEDYNGTVLDTQIVAKGGYATAVPNPSRPTTTTGIYTFTGWKDSDGNDFSFNTPITGDITIIAQYDEQAISLEETDIVSIQFRYNGSTDNWLIFTLSNHDYACATGGTAYSVSYEELQRIGFLDNVILKGTIGSGSTTSTVSEATLAEIFAQNGRGEGRYINTWGEGTFGIRIINTPAYDSIKEIVVKAGTQFPSYEYACNDGETDTRFMVYSETVFQSGTATQGVDSAGNKVDSWTTPFGATVSGYDIYMADGAAIRITNLDNYDGSQNYMETEGYKKSGIRFQTWISKESLAQMQSYLADGIYTSVSFGTLIVPSADLVGGEFTHEWLEANSIQYMDIASSAELTQGGWAFAAETDDEVTFFGSIVNLKSTNHNRYFSGVGYIAIVKEGETEPTYFYASYNQSSSRSASYIAQAAVADRSETQDGPYKYKIEENNNWSPYTEGEIAFLKLYMGTLTETEATAESFTLTSDGKLSSDASSTRNTGTLTVNKKLSGAYVTLNYQTNIDVWGKFYYRNAADTKSAVEDFYLPKGSSQHKQYLDLFRYNGVGTLAGLTANDLYLTKIEFQNATVDMSSSGTFKFLGLYSSNNTLDTANLEVYVTKSLTAGGEMTVGAHLGLGGALTYLAKSGIYEGVTGQSENSSFYQNYLGYTKYKYNTGSIVLSKDSSVFDENRATGNKTTEAGYYGHAESSKPGDGAVNLINNYDAGRQIQQSWYANVGGSLSGNTGANGYTRLDCTTGAGGYWPYNPVQAGDCKSNPGQIIDYEVNKAKGYIYVKTRAMDWAYGDTSKGGYEYGSTTKSYMENYYRLNADGTVYVNNSFVDWNGFTDMDKCDYQLVELPALYPVQTLNYFFTYDGASPWTGGSLTKRSDLSSWTGGTSHYQSTNDTAANGKVGEEWVAWANDTNGSVALGMYIPNVNRFTSGRSQNAVTTATSANVNASSNYLKSKGLMSNMPAISYSYQSTYVQNTSYTAAGVSFRMEAYVPIEYTYVLAVNDINTIRSQFKAIYESGKVTNASSQAGVKAGLDAWARSDKIWTQV